MKAKVTEKCGSILSGKGLTFVCQKQKCHKGAHNDSREGFWETWHDRDAERVAARELKAEIDKQ